MATNTSGPVDISTNIPKSYRQKGFNYTVSQPLCYPLEFKSEKKATHGPSRHFIRFYINLDEESHYISQNTIGNVGTVDQTDQARTRNRPLNQETVQNYSAVIGATKGLTTDTSGVSESISNLAGFNGNALRGVSSLASKTVLAAGGALIAYEAVKNIKIDKKLKRLATTITLYTPATIGMNQTANWDNNQDVMYQLLELLGESTAGEIMKNGGGIANTLGRIIATGASETVQGATRTAVNPKKDLLFKSMNRRDFQFEYQFAPRSKEESDEVANIVQVFRLFAAPEVVQGTDQFLMTFPAEFDIEYGFIDENGNETQNMYLNKISSCVLENIGVNYSPNGTFQTLENGDPIQVNLTLHF
ncbi:MAG TPA: hypothetical protein VFM18_13020, partial [Methanosarcina sp.]|nr:hypothetical protein [Methanosarcina sp.]